MHSLWFGITCTSWRSTLGSAALWSGSCTGNQNHPGICIRPKNIRVFAQGVRNLCSRSPLPGEGLNLHLPLSSSGLATWPGTRHCPSPYPALFLKLGSQDKETLWSQEEEKVQDQGIQLKEGTISSSLGSWSQWDRNFPSAVYPVQGVVGSFRRRVLVMPDSYSTFLGSRKCRFKPSLGEERLDPGCPAPGQVPTLLNYWAKRQ